MKKFILVLALLLVCGSAYAASIPNSVAPKSGPEVWTTEAYNNAGVDLSSCSVVKWDYTNLTMNQIDSRKMYVANTTTADDIATAGVVVDPTCVAGSECTIAIWGPVPVKVTGTVTAGTALGSSATSGKATGYANTGNDDGVLGWSINATSNATVGGGADIAIVFVNPTVMAD